MSKVLIIDDDSGVCRTLKVMVGQQGHEACTASTLAQGLEMIARESIDLVLLDVHLPDGNGLEKIPAIAQSPSRPEIIILTGQGDPDGADLAIRNGAWDYIEKSSSPKAMALRFLRVLEYRTHKNLLRRALPVDREGIIGVSEPLMQALAQLSQTMGSDAGVLIAGETGTGKELFAQAVHRNSNRKGKNFVVVDCAALPKTLVESVLFGHVKGAFTGADGPREGLIVQADGGTLFLDEVGEMPLELQKTFLRVLESHRFRPIGGKQEVASDFRIIASTNRDLDAMVHEGTFRGDLLYRLRAFHLILPPLRERREDIRELALHHLRRVSVLYGVPTKELSPDFLDLLEAYHWPGNVRELVNTMECGLAAARFETVLFDFHLPTRLRAHVIRQKVSGRPPQQTPAAPMIKSDGAFPLLQTVRDQAIEKAEVDYLNALMTTAEGSIAKACTLSGVSRSRLYELLKKHAIA
ncbi:MAG: sigma-54-dependent Fis family transcriptional regulator [Desulfobacterales bacterium]|nr:sigma-54-dependent Fis family transcriptional regulator [Desulfobacterales bacterium]